MTGTPFHDGAIRVPSVEGRSASPEAQRVGAQHLKDALGQRRDADRDLVARLHTYAEANAKFRPRLALDIDEAAREITRLRQRVRDLDQALSDAEHRLTWGHH